MKKRTRRKYKLFFMALFMCAAFSLLRSNVFAAETYPFEEYYDPEEDEWANEERVNMDGELEFTVPDMKVKTMDLIVYGSGNPKLQKIRNSENKSVDYKEKHSDDTSYTYYTVSDVSKGDWDLKVSSSDMESTKVYLIYHSTITARYAIEQELKDPDSGNYQALIRLYQTKDQVLKLTNRKVNYLIDDYSLMSETTKDAKFNCYLGEPGLTEDDMKFLKDKYSFHIIMTAKNGTIVLADAKQADNSEFKDIKGEYNPSWWARFRAKPKEEQRNSILMAVVLGTIFISAVVFLRKTHYLKKRKEKMKSIRKNRFQTAVVRAKKAEKNFVRFEQIRKEAEKLLEELEPYVFLVEGSITKEERDGIENMLQEDFKDALKRCSDNAVSMKDRWTDIRQEGRRISEDEEKKLMDKIAARESMISSNTDELERYKKKLEEIKKEIDIYQERRMYHEIHVFVQSGDYQYFGVMTDRSLGLPRKKGIQNLNLLNLKEDGSKRKISFGDFDLHGLAVGIAQTSDQEEQEIVLISNKKLCCDAVDMEEKIRESVLGPYQYTDIEGLKLYVEDEKETMFWISK